MDRKSGCASENEGRSTKLQMIQYSNRTGSMSPSSLLHYNALRLVTVNEALFFDGSCAAFLAFQHLRHNESLPHHIFLQLIANHISTLLEVDTAATFIAQV